MSLLLDCLARLPLPLLHALGWLLGWAIWLASPAYRRRWRENTAQAGLSGASRWASVGEAGKQVTELPRLWFGAPVRVDWEGAEHVEAALARSSGLLFLTPHMGCFEITAQAYAQRFGAEKPMTVLFRPPRKPALAVVLQRARDKPGLQAAPATLAGVRQLIQALKRGGAVGLLPDQVPPEGLGVWAPFFGRLAYTMTLSARFARTGDTRVLLAWGERLSWGRGYRIHVEPLDRLIPELGEDPLEAATRINRAMEILVARCPRQYLWGYARYKQPRSG